MTLTYPIKLRDRAIGHIGVEGRIIARVSNLPAQPLTRAEHFLVVKTGDKVLAREETEGHAGVLVERGAEGKMPDDAGAPVVDGFESVDFLEPGAIVAVDQGGRTNVLFRPTSRNNAIFATGRCNSNCLMCSQPPVEEQDPDVVDQHIRVINLMTPAPAVLGITGGEPTLLGEGLVRILGELKQRLPDTYIHMLTNGRRYTDFEFVKSIANAAPPHFTSAIPLYSDNPAEHDYIVQAEHAFEETLAGLYNAARFGLDVEIRVVLHKQTIPRLLQLAEFIYRNVPFVRHVALMGLENMGYVKKNWDLLWIDPVEFQNVLEAAVRHFFYRGMHVSIYNLQLCVLPPTLWPFARQSISDYKNIFLDECMGCVVRSQCGGLFASSSGRHSRGIRALNAV